MKKFLALFIVLAILSGCAAVQEPVPTETEAPTDAEPTVATPEVTEPVETEPEPVAEQLPMVAISIPTNVKTSTAEDGTVIFRQTSQSMQLTMRDPDVADKIILDFLNRTDAHNQAAADIEAEAQTADHSDPAGSIFFYDLIYNPTRIDHSVLSLYGEAVSYSGGNHPQRICTAANYNMVTGDVLTLGSILHHIDSKNTLVDLVLNSLDSIAEEKYLLDGYDDVVRKRFEKDESFDEDWYFTNEGLCFYFAPYEIAPYASGVIVAQIPYSELTGVIADEFFPAEEDLGTGNILTSHIDSADMDQFTQIAEITIDQAGEMIFLYTDGILRNVQIHAGAYNAERDVFVSNAVIFSTYTLTPGDALMLKIQISDDMADLQLTYESGGELHHDILTSEFLNG